jgi:hypothetical protein
MSGLEVAGVVLGAFPLLLSGIEHWRDVAKVGGFFRRIRAEYAKCRGNVQFHEILYKANLKELLIPLMLDSDEVAKFIFRTGWPRMGGRFVTEAPVPKTTRVVANLSRHNNRNE